jgi:predicted permease
VLGRDFHVSDDIVNGPNVAILSDGLWRRRFSADPAIVGRAITLNDTSYTIVGVMPAALENVLAPSAEVWALMQYDLALPGVGREWGHHLRLAARLRPDVRFEQAQRELNGIASAPLAEFPRVPWAALSQGFIVHPLQDDVTQAVRPALLAVAGAVMLVLTIACVNVTNLLLAQSARRQGEIAMRMALGAGRLRLLRQLLAESLLLAACGGALGMLVASAGVRALVALSPPGLPRVDAIQIDSAIFAFAFGVSLVVGVAVGLVPAMRASRRDLRGRLHEASRTTAGSHQRTRRALVVAEVALAIVLLVCAGLLLRSLQRLFAVAPGFQPEHLLTLQVQTSGRQFNDAATTHRFFAAAVDAVRNVPGVEAAGFSSQLPFSGSDDQYGVHFEMNSPGIAATDGSALRYAVTPGYLETMGIPLRGGRRIDPHDAVPGAPGIVVISESLAKRQFPDGGVIGQRLRIGTDDQPWRTVVGVVGDVRQTSLAASQTDAVYLPSSQWPFTDRVLWLSARTHGDPAPLATAVKSAIWSVDKDQPIVRVGTMDRLVEASAAERRFALVLFEAFALTALALAAIGLYGVLSGAVTERTREIGVRAALGASRADILALVVRQGMTLATVGVGVGLGGAALASGTLATLLFDVSRMDPLTYVGVTVLLAAVAAVACGLPAWRAARVDPSITLRAE